MNNNLETISQQFSDQETRDSMGTWSHSNSTSPSLKEIRNCLSVCLSASQSLSLSLLHISSEENRNELANTPEGRQPKVFIVDFNFKSPLIIRLSDSGLPSHQLIFVRWPRKRLQVEPAEQRSCMIQINLRFEI